MERREIEQLIKESRYIDSYEFRKLYFSLLRTIHKLYISAHNEYWKEIYRHMLVKEITKLRNYRKKNDEQERLIT